MSIRRSSKTVARARPKVISHVPVSVMILALNEEVNLPHCLESVSWSDDIVVIDSGSTDHTVDIAEKFGARVFHHSFTGFGSQRNWALENTNMMYDWVLILDADERVPESLATEIGERLSEAGRDGAAFRVRRRFHMWGRWMRRSSLYPTWVVRLVRKGKVDYIDRGHAETQDVDGVVLDLSEDIIDENHKGLEHWFERQNRYSTQDARYELDIASEPGWWRSLFASDPLSRRTALKSLAIRFPFRSFGYFLYSFFLRGGILEGRQGFCLCLMRAQYYWMVGIKKREISADTQEGRR